MELLRLKRRMINLITEKNRPKYYVYLTYESGYIYTLYTRENKQDRLRHLIKHLASIYKRASIKEQNKFSSTLVIDLNISRYGYAKNRRGRFNYWNGVVS